MRLCSTGVCEVKRIRFFREASRLPLTFDRIQLSKTKRPVSIQTQAFSYMIDKIKAYQLKRNPAIMPHAA